MHRRTHMAQLTKEQSQTRFLAIVLPLLTLCTHTLLALSSILPGSDPDRAVFSFIYNLLAGGASTLGLAGAIRLLPKFISIYTFVHTTTLAFATIALFSTPFDFQPVNPVVPSWHMNENAVCEDIDASFGWDQEWLDKCSRSFSVIKWCIACLGLMLMVAQWWALFMVKSWGTELRSSRCERDPDVEKNTVLHDNDLVDFK